VAELLVWPALFAYGEAAVAYAGNTRRPGRLGAFATWGVRVGWLAQTALLVVQAADAGGFPSDTWAGSLNLFVWLVVSGYLIWGCRARYRVLGLVVMPPAAVLLAVAHAAGGTTVDAGGRYSDLFLVLHVGLVLAGLAGFTLAAALAALYLWHERRLKRREARILRLEAPALVAAERLTWRAIAVGLPLFTAGVVAGLLRLSSEDVRFDPLMGAALLTCGAYGSFLALRHLGGWHGRRGAYLALAGVVLVVVLRLGLSATHI
jgi:ABC-type uncharacterized transport system permease subunit